MSDLVIKPNYCGRGAYATRDFLKGELVTHFRGKLYLAAQNPRGLHANNSHFLQIGKDLYIGPSRTPDNFVNHSCDPNTAVYINGNISLYAIKKIKAGEEITFDYSTTMDEGGVWEMECFCGSINCRGIIRDFKFLPEETKTRYIAIGIVPDFVLED